MNNSKRWLLMLLTTGFVVILLISVLTILPVLAQGPGGMMHGFGFNNGQTGGYGPGWMHRSQGPRGMMDGYGPRWGYNQDNDGSGAYGYGCPGMGSGRWDSNSPLFNTEPLSMAETVDAVNSFIADLNDDNLALGEVMIFDNHAYAEVVEKDSAIGAMELLVDPATKAVYPEMGPNMMWNLKYGMMAGYGSYGPRRQFGWQGDTIPNQTSAEMSVTPAQAVEAAQAYLNSSVGNNLVADEHVDPFYGYYTLHVNRAGETIGMLSVNGYTGDVFLHTWHGNLVAMSEE